VPMARIPFPSAPGRVFGSSRTPLSGHPSATSRTQATGFIHNSIAISTCTGASCTFQYYWPGMGTSSPGPVFTAPGTDWFWPMDGFVYNGTLYLALDADACSGSGGAFGFAYSGVSVGQHRQLHRFSVPVVDHVSAVEHRGKRGTGNFHRRQSGAKRESESGRSPGRWLRLFLHGSGQPTLSRTAAHSASPSEQLSPGPATPTGNIWAPAAPGRHGRTRPRHCRAIMHR
jgi:hypothetical protein